jgi:hypothetical protein
VGKAPRVIRPEPEDIYVVNLHSSRASSAPRELVAVAGPFNTVTLHWFGPDDVGSDRITGYVINRSVDDLVAPSIYVLDTGTAATTYEDLLADTSQHIYSYTVQAINAYGTSVASNIAYFTTNEWADGIGYIVTSQDNSPITTGDGTYIVL